MTVSDRNRKQAQEDFEKLAHITPDQAVFEMAALASSDDTEQAHGDADDILLRLLKAEGHDDLCLRFLELDKWYA